MSGFYQYDTRGASQASQIVNLERMVEERDTRIEELTRDLTAARALSERQRVEGEGYRAAILWWALRCGELQKEISRIAPSSDPQPKKAPCGECHLKSGETCDVCGAQQP